MDYAAWLSVAAVSQLCLGRSDNVIEAGAAFMSGLRRRTESSSRDPLFFVTFPDREAAEKIGELAQDLRAEYGLKGEPLRVDRFHVTLRLLGGIDLPPSVIAAAREAVSAIAMRPFKVAFDHILSLNGRQRRPLALCGGEGVVGLEALKHDIDAALAKIGFRYSIGRTFRPHVTMLYDAAEIPPRPVKQICWTVRDLHLVHSLQGRTIYRTLEHWQLRRGGYLRRASNLDGGLLMLPHGIAFRPGTSTSEG